MPSPVLILRGSTWAPAPLPKPEPAAELSVWGCHNREELAATITVQAGWTPDGRRITAEVPTGWLPGCRYDLKATDPKCGGCRWLTA
jgi:hypothetical protein